MEFKKALPVWIKDLSNEMNMQAGFVSKFTAKGSATLRITGSTLYRVYINGEFVHYGPARAGHGYARVDELDISNWLKDAENTIAIEVAGYNCYSYYTINQVSFLAAEIICGEAVVCATGSDFIGIRIYERAQKAMRYSFQRPFTEIWSLNAEDWKKRQTGDDLEIVKLDLKLLPREVPIPKFERMNFLKQIESGSFEVSNISPIKDRYITNISDEFTGFLEAELYSTPFYTIQAIEYKAKTNNKYLISSNEYSLFDMGRNASGFINLKLFAKENSKILVYFDEKLIDNKIIFKKSNVANVIEYNLAGGQEYDLLSFESYGFKFICVAVISGCVEIKNIGMIEYKYPLTDVEPPFTNDKELMLIYNAAVETFRQNTVDIFMDCPTRERAGWLCDSYFTAQAEYSFTKSVIVEKVFMENFVLPEKMPFLPKGMLPMCYPADHPNVDFIPQWAIWYVIELEKYLERDKNADVNFYKKTCYNLVSYLDIFLNEDGLLEKLPGWNFVEWSKANEWVNDVNYPTNMLYCKALKIIANLYADNSLLQRSLAMKQKIIELSFDGELFVDNAVRNAEGILVNTKNHSEACQYYAFFFDIIAIDDEKYNYLRNMIYNVFGPDREENAIMPEIEYANVLMGIYMRLELLLKWGEYEKLLSEIKKYFGGMAEHTGTLWEHNKPLGSLNHGFASYAGVIIKQCLQYNKI